MVAASGREQRGKPALLIVDMINPLDYPGARRLREQAIPAARAIARPKGRLKGRGPSSTSTTASPSGCGTSTTWSHLGGRNTDSDV